MRPPRASLGAVAGLSDQTAGAQQAAIISSGLEPNKREGHARHHRLQATFEVGLVALQAILYRSRAATPYVLSKSLAIQRGRGRRTATRRSIVARDAQRARLLAARQLMRNRRSAVSAIVLLSCMISGAPRGSHSRPSNQLALWPIP